MLGAEHLGEVAGEGSQGAVAAYRSVRWTIAVALAAALAGVLSGRAATQGTALKVSAPVPHRPAKDEVVSSATPRLTSAAAIGRFVTGAFEHHFEVWSIADDGSMALFDSGTTPAGPGLATYTLGTALGTDGRYGWRVRAGLDRAFGPWSTWATFRYDYTRTRWTLRYAEDFSSQLNDATPWTLDDYREPFDTIMDDPGRWYQNDYGPAWRTALDSFATYRKEFPVGQDGWLTASLSARDWDRDGVIEAPPSITTEIQSGRSVAVLDVPDHTGGAIFRPTKALPTRYRLEYTLTTLDFGGKLDGSLDYDGRTNGYATGVCKTQHPWGEGSGTPGWAGDPLVPYCEWQDVTAGPFAYNGFHFLSIVDFADPAPRNNHFWHYHRKVLMDAFSQHPDRVGTGTGGRICDSRTGQYYAYRDSSFNTVNMWISALPEWTPLAGGLPANSQWFITNCSNGIAEPQLSSAAELQPELMPEETYIFAIERDATGYVLEATGNFARVGWTTIRFQRPFVVDEVPIWHYNTVPGEYDGRFNDDLVQNGAFGAEIWPDQWPAGSAYPDYFVIGDLYTNVYEGRASLTDIRLYVPAGGENARLDATAPRWPSAQLDANAILASPDAVTVMTASDGTRFRVETVATGLDGPTSLSFAADGRLFLAERRGRVRIIESGALLPRPALTLSDAAPPDEAGAPSLALHPGFAHNRHVYLGYAVAGEGRQLAHRLVRFRELGSSLVEPVVLFEDGLTGPRFHGGLLRFGPDTKLYMTVGDIGAGTLAQDLAAFSGKILRFDRDGTTPSDNPFGSPVFSLGHRDLRGLDWHPVSGDLWATEQSGGRDELNVITGGGNYGWPLTTGGRTVPSTETPARAYLPAIELSGATFYAGALFPTFENDLFFTSSVGYLHRVRLDPNDPRRIVDEERLLDGQFGRLGDVVAGPDGAIYLATDREGRNGAASGGDQILRLVPAR